jgi:hypothetical protein
MLSIHTVQGFKLAAALLGPVVLILAFHTLVSRGVAGNPHDATRTNGGA